MVEQNSSRSKKVIDAYQLPCFLKHPELLQLSTHREISTLKEALNKFEIKNFVISQQTHEDKIYIAEDIKGGKELEGYDAFLTAQPGTALIIKTADCTPVFLYDPQKKVIGAIHAGRRSTILKITEQTVKTMIEYFNCDPKNILAGIGPAICKTCYQIDPVKDIHFDLWQENHDQLINSGVPPKNIELSGLCPSCNANERFFSYRKDKTQTRTYNIIMKRN